MRESEEGKGGDILKTEDMDEARKRWMELCESGKAKYFGFDNGIYIVEGARE